MRGGGDRGSGFSPRVSWSPASRDKPNRPLRKLRLVTAVVSRWRRSSWAVGAPTADERGRPLPTRTITVDLWTQSAFGRPRPPVIADPDYHRYKHAPRPRCLSYNPAGQWHYGTPYTQVAIRS